MPRSLLVFPRALIWILALMSIAPTRGLRAEDDKKAIRQAIIAGDVEKLDDALSSLAQSGGASAMRLVLDYMEKMPASQDSLYWSLVGGAVSFRDKAAMEEIGKYVVAKKGSSVAKDLLYGLAKNSSPFFVMPFKPLMLEGPDELRVMVARKVSTIRSHDSVDALVELLKREEKAKGEKLGELGWIAVEGLTRITGQNFGPSPINWDGWWQKSRDNPLPQAGDADSAARTGTAVDFLKLSPDRARREAFIGVESAPLKSVVVLSGEFTKKVQKDLNNDKMQSLLTQMNVPHTVVKREDFPNYELKDAGVLLINCVLFHEMCICPTCKPSGAKNSERLFTCSGCEKHIKWSCQLSGAEVKKIKAFVMGGGYLFAEDWIAEEVVEKAFPEFIAADEKQVLKGASVDVMPGRGMGSHPYLKGIFEPRVLNVPPEFSDSRKVVDDGKVGSTVVVKRAPEEGGEVGAEQAPPVQVKHQWKIDDKSYALKVMDKSRVVTLLTSGMLQRDTGGDGSVALCFRPGPPGVPPAAKNVPRGAPGVVTVVLSHFKEQTSMEDNMSIQTLLLNILLDANAARMTRSGKIEGGKKTEKNERKPAGGE